MGRYDQDDISHLDLPDPVQTTGVYYNTQGVAIDRDEFNQIEQQDQPKICAKRIQHMDSGIVNHFVLCSSDGHMFDPRNTDRRYKLRNVWSFRRVSRTSFDLYIKFLQQKYTSFLQQAQRGL